MSTKHPNRVGEICTYSDHNEILTLSGIPLPGMRSITDARSAGDLADLDTVGISIEDASDETVWIVCTAQVTWSTLSNLSYECSSPNARSTIGTAVNVKVGVTAASLAAAIDEAIVASGAP